MKKALMLRVGGLGDILILTPIAKELHKRGYEVDFFCGSPTGDVWELIKGLPYLHDVKKIERNQITNTDCVKLENEDYISVEILKDKYDEVFDFKYSVEANVAGLNKRGGWRESINSNYNNWIDLSFGWANIDPASIAVYEKIPEIHLDSKYIDFVLSTPLGQRTGRQFRVIGIQLQASTLIRTWYKAGELPELLHKAYPNDMVVVFANNWICITSNGKFEIKYPEGYNPLCCSAALISQMDCFISADSGSSHLAEATEVPTVGIYTTVPAWTRTKHYVYAHPIEAIAECFPCFTLDAFCPLEKKKAEESLNERERDILDAAKRNADINEYARKYNVPPKAIEMEAQSAFQKMQALSTTEPACVKSITADMILEKVSNVINGVPRIKKIIDFTETINVLEK